MNNEIDFPDGTQLSASGGCVAVSRQGMTAEDVIYRVATMTAVLFILITML